MNTGNNKPPRRGEHANMRGHFMSSPDRQRRQPANHLKYRYMKASEPVVPSEEKVYRYYALWKPYGVSSRFGETKNALALEAYVPIDDVFPIGYLDTNSEGLLLLTDNPRFRYGLNHTKSLEQRIFLAQVALPASPCLEDEDDEEDEAEDDTSEAQSAEADANDDAEREDDGSSASAEASGDGDDEAYTDEEDIDDEDYDDDEDDEDTISAEALKALREGVLLSDGRTMPMEVDVIADPCLPERSLPVKEGVRTCWLSIACAEGWSRHIRRVTAAVGYPTLRLVQWALGPASLFEMCQGQLREFNYREMQWVNSVLERSPEPLTAAERKRFQNGRSSGQRQRAHFKSTAKPERWAVKQSPNSDYEESESAEKRRERSKRSRHERPNNFGKRPGSRHHAQGEQQPSRRNGAERPGQSSTGGRPRKQTGAGPHSSGRPQRPGQHRHPGSGRPGSSRPQSPHAPKRSSHPAPKRKPTRSGNKRR